MSELTGEQLTEKFFTEVKGWEQIYVDGDLRWTYNGVLQNYSCDAHLQLHTSLDLQEEWLWPELRKKEYYHIDFNEDCLKPINVSCYILAFNSERFEAEAPTKALAQLKAGLKALGVI